MCGNLIKNEKRKKKKNKWGEGKGKRTQESEAGRRREDRAVSGTLDLGLKETLEDANPNSTSKISQPPPPL